MGLDAWLTVAVLVVLMGVLVREVLAPAAAVFGALLVLVLLDVATPELALTGFASPATATVAGLFVVAAALQQHGGLEHLIERLLSSTAGDRGVLARLSVPVAAASSVIANTPIVAALAPVVRNSAERTGRAPSQLLMPLSFATILGGLATTIGTSTTLVASGIVRQATGEPFGLLEVTPIGLPAAVAGTVLLVLLAPWLLPDRGGAFHTGVHDYTFRMIVTDGGALDGVALGDAGLRDLDKLFVAEIERPDAVTVPARPDARLRGGDVLVFTGNAEHAETLPSDGLQHAAHAQLQALGQDRTGLYEAVVGRGSQLVGRTLKDLSFRGRFDAAVLGIARADTRVRGKLGTVPLAAGDVLLLRAASDFSDRWRGSGEFAVVSRIDHEATIASPRRPLALGVAAVMILVAATGMLSLLEAVLWACVVLVVTGTIDVRGAVESLDLDVLLIIASAIGIGATVEASGLAGAIASWIGDVAMATSVPIALLLVLVTTALLTEIVTNVASAALMIPIALDAAETVGAQPRGWAVAVAVAASASFLTPIGYQTNTIVYGLGGYRFGDFWRLGLPINALVVAVAVVAVPIVWG